MFNGNTILKDADQFDRVTMAYLEAIDQCPITGAFCEFASDACEAGTHCPIK